ncbi:hypothetical protein LCGC14_1968480 [marine sediment metagenome]|uniref:Uncharacterized protein n=1 Tax=marine sediment metagenome TaxID=412755 RepID=A0A0F9FCU0_9ZZZZ
MTDSQRDEIARLIIEGSNRGRIDDEQQDGSFEYVAWELKTTEWKD